MEATVPPSLRPGTPPRADTDPRPDPRNLDPRIEEAFRKFRESVVRLVEQVNDLQSTTDDPGGLAQREVRIVRAALGKWSAEILLALHALPSAGFEDLRRTLNGISARVLSIKLRELEENGMVRRDILGTRPPRVRYSLTERGWTIAWLAQPFLLFMRLTAPSDLPAAAPAHPVPSLGTGRPLPGAGRSWTAAKTPPDPPVVPVAKRRTRSARAGP